MRRHVDHVADLDVQLGKPVRRALGALGSGEFSMAWM
jgi:hypothetical protein